MAQKLRMELLVADSRDEAITNEFVLRILRTLVVTPGPVVLAASFEVSYGLLVTLLARIHKRHAFCKNSVLTRVVTQNGMLPDPRVTRIIVGSISGGANCVHVGDKSRLDHAKDVGWKTKAEGVYFLSVVV